MANFEKVYELTRKNEGGFQNDPDDSANYVNGKLIGTNKGISAQAYYKYFNRVPSEADMRMISSEVAKAIFKKNYWDKIQGDLIKSQSVSELMFQYIIGAGPSQLSDLKDIANMVAGKKLLASVDVPFTVKEIEIINSLNARDYWDALKKWRHEYFIIITNKNPKLKKFLKGWQDRLNRYVYVPVGDGSDEKKKGLSQKVKTLLALLLLVFLFLFLRSRM